MSLVSLTKIEGNNMKQAIAESLNLLGYTFRKGPQNIVIARANKKMAVK